MPWISLLWSSSDLWETIEYFAETTVIAGAAIEVLPDFEFVLRGEHNRDLRHRIGKWAAIALVLGLAIGLGALVRTNSLFTATIASAYKAAKDASDRAISASNSATNAQDRANEANTKLAGALDRLGKAEKQVKDEQVEIARAMEETAKSDARAAEALSMARSAELPRAELEAQIAPRTLTVLQREYIGKILGPFGPQFLGRQVKLDWLLSDVEPTIFAVELEDSLKRAGIGWRDLPLPCWAAVSGLG